MSPKARRALLAFAGLVLAGGSSLITVLVGDADECPVCAKCVPCEPVAPEQDVIPGTTDTDAPVSPSPEAPAPPL